MQKILVIDEYEPIRKYLHDKLSSYNFEVTTARNGLEGMIKLRKIDPDLVIMDYYLTRKSIGDVLKEKQADPNLAHIPIIILTSGLGKRNIALLAKYNIRKILSKPIKIDLLFSAISSVLGTRLLIDKTPCLLEAHFNTNILFIEIAGGLNREKIELLKYKIIELMELYKVKKPGVLIIMSDISEATVSFEKMQFLLATITGQTGTPEEAIKLLTSSEIIIDLVRDKDVFKKIEITDDLEKAMNSLTGVKITSFLEEGKNIVKKDFITTTEEIHSKKENILMKFDRDTAILDYNTLKSDITLAVIDDDDIIHSLIKTAFTGSGWDIKYYENGLPFIKDLEKTSFDIIFLDLMMPKMDGFKVLDYLHAKEINYPVIILSALSRIETINQAIGFGVKSYMIKPLHIDLIIKKTCEILKKNF